MFALKPMKLLLPGLFLLILGVGNIGVGIFKGRQYQQVIDDLAHLQPTPRPIGDSPLIRLRYAEKTSDRRYQRQRKAEDRCEFYRLVTAGGKVLVGSSLLLLLPGTVLVVRRRRGTLQR